MARNNFDQVDDSPSGMSLAKKIVLGAVALVLTFFGITVAFGSWYTVGAGYLGVIARNGAIIGTAEPGFHLKAPWIDEVHDVKVATQRITYENVHAYTSDQQTSISKITVIWHLDPNKVVSLINNAGYKYWEPLITPVAPTKYKAVINSNTAAQIITKRDKMAIEVADHLRPILADRGIVLESVQLENIDFSKEYEKAVEEAVKASSLVTKAEQDLRRKQVEAEQARIEAEGKAKAAIEQAKGEAEAVRRKAEAEAEALDKVGSALAKNPRLVEKLAVEKWNGTVPTTMVPGSAVPFVNMNTLK